jgi:purine-cytosine permease-like protein
LVLHAFFGLHEMMVLGLALRKALGDTGVSHSSSALGRRLLEKIRKEKKKV